ncbi:MAG: EI24 domain-containing protein [Alphaproteobacteria bacterium]|nr:EI24 domain-containing protein [Alphaproteobacteria bacterium]
MLSDLFTAIAQLADPRFRGVLWRALAGAVVVFAGLLAGWWWLLERSTLFESGWLEKMADVLGGLAALGLSLLLFPVVVTLVAGLLLDEIVQAVEDRHYPDLGPPPPTPWWQGLPTAARFVAITVVLNLLALPLYLVPGANLIVFYALNGYLLGREYFEMVALRRLAPAQARALRLANGVSVWLAGILIAVLSTVPVVNLMVPIIATAFATHRFQALRKTGGAV